MNIRFKMPPPQNQSVMKSPPSFFSVHRAQSTTGNRIDWYQTDQHDLKPSDLDSVQRWLY
jgi:hypothetical protein